jgi:long-chain acyl-CoA synthetase
MSMPSAVSTLILDKNLPQTFFKRVQKSPYRSAMIRKISGTWRTLTWSEYQNEVVLIAKSLLAEGIKLGDRVAILSNSRPEWAWVDVATMAVGAVTVPIYPSLLPDDILYILRDSGAKIVFAEDNSHRKKLEEILGELKHIVRVVLFNEVVSETGLFQTFSEWLSKSGVSDGKASSADVLGIQALSQGIDASALASIVYTSGTSGQPKGVELRHECFLGFMRGVEKALGVTENDTTLLFLPMAHILGRVEHMLSLGVGWTNAYAENLKVMIDNLLEVRPTVLVSVPRIYEKIYSMVLGKISKGSVIEKTLGQKAVEFATTYSKVLESGKQLDLIEGVQYKLFSKILYSKVAQRFGGRLRFCISGGAPFSPEISRFFHASGVLVLEGYGLTETTGPLTLNKPNKFRIGSVGQAIEGVELKIAEDGEILARGDVVMKRYHQKEAATQEVMDSEGFFATGDIGRLDSEGFLYITDRKKDILVTAGGKNIAPQKIESMLLEDPLFAQAIVLGDKQKYLGALVALNMGEARQMAKEASLHSTSIEELYANTLFQQLVKKRVDRVNTRLASFEAIKRVGILPRELRVEEGELTPSLKVKRRFVEKKYADLVAKLFE